MSTYACIWPSYLSNEEFKMNKVSFDVVPSSSLSYEIVYVTNGNENEISYVMA